ncbi:hypothetical protein [Aurantimonas sp. C2-3-R2]|uniref:hypothetical protein n=1 Tax=Aurantimonas sp. C2-3-R2 TaxID=3114363 RepID=UPI002E191CFC|nr:hypothetical protein [Aurantimonas sp. C2-3-R2]
MHALTGKIAAGTVLVIEAPSTTTGTTGTLAASKRLTLSTSTAGSPPKYRATVAAFGLRLDTDDPSRTTTSSGMMSENAEAASATRAFSSASCPPVGDPSVMIS